MTHVTTALVGWRIVTGGRRFHYARRTRPSGRNRGCDDEYGGPTPPDPNQPGGGSVGISLPRHSGRHSLRPVGVRAAGGGPARGGAPPPNYLVWAILSTLFCCLPLGIVSIVFSSQVNSKLTAGDYGRRPGRLGGAKAKQFAIWSAIAGVIVGITCCDRRSPPARDCIDGLPGRRCPLGRRWLDRRPVAAAAAGALAVVATVDPNEPGHYPTCPFLALTGHTCPAAARASHALTHGDSAAAASRNADGGLGAAAGVGWRVPGLGAPQLTGDDARTAPAAALWGVVVLVVGFWKLRNLDAGAALAP